MKTHKNKLSSSSSNPNLPQYDIPDSLQHLSFALTPPKSTFSFSFKSYRKKSRSSNKNNYHGAHRKQYTRGPARYVIPPPEFYGADFSQPKQKVDLSALNASRPTNEDGLRETVVKRETLGKVFVKGLSR